VALRTPPFGVLLTVTRIRRRGAAESERQDNERHKQNVTMFHPTLMITSPWLYDGQI
jgi:hypothetical protein